MILWILLLILAVAVAWVVRAAGWRFALRRFGGAALIILVVTFLTTWLLRQVGIDEQTEQALVEQGLPVESAPCVSSLGTGADKDSVLECVDELSLDKPLVTQYWSWLSRTVSGDLGFAYYKTQIPLWDADPETSDVVTQRGPRTVWLFVYAQLVALAFAVPLGIWSAYQAGRRPRRLPPAVVLALAIAALVVVGFAAGWSLSGVIAIGVLVPLIIYHGFRGGPAADSTVNVFAFILLSVPVFVLGETLRYEFSINRDWYDLVGYAPWAEGARAHLSSVWLPALTLGLATTPIYLRLLRNDMRQNLQQDYVAVAKAKGMTDRHVLWRHVLRPSTLTLLTVFGLNIAQLVNGAVVTEYIYDFDGMGSYVFEAVFAREFFPIQTLTAIVAVLFVFANTLIDVVYTAIDPRVVAEERD